MVDLHSHILAGLDDGASTLEESLEMLRLAASSGTTGIVATPHCNAQYSFDPALVADAVRQLAAYHTGPPQIHTGCDFHLSYDNLRDALEHPAKYTIKQGRYLLVELPDFVSLAAIRQVLRELLNARLIPVITHPERNPSLQRQPKELHAWVADGCLLQVTAQSLFGVFGSQARRTAHALLNARLVHFIASDAHDTAHRPPVLSDAFHYIAARYGAPCAHALFTANPSAVLQGLRLPPPPPAPGWLTVVRSFFHPGA